MPKNVKRNIIVIIISALVFALLINFLLSAEWGVIPTRFSNHDWLDFWSSYATGIFAIIIGYCTIVSSNLNSRRAIMQQDAILIRQKSDEIYKEIVEEIKLHLNLFNLISFTSTILVAPVDELPARTDEVLKKKSSIAERQIHWTLIKSLYLQSEHVASFVEEYEKVWNPATDKLFDYVQLELELFGAIDHARNIDFIVTTQKDLLTRLNEKKRSNSIDSEINDLISNTERSINENQQKKMEVNQQYKDVISKLSKSIDGLSTLQDEVFNAATKFLINLSSYSFIRFQKEEKSS